MAPMKSASKNRAREPGRGGAGESGLDRQKNFQLSADIPRNVQCRLQGTVDAAIKEGLLATCQVSEACHSQM